MAYAPVRVDAAMLQSRAAQLFRRPRDGGEPLDAIALATACTEFDLAAAGATPATLRARLAPALARVAGGTAPAAVRVRPALVAGAASLLGAATIGIVAAVGEADRDEAVAAALEAGAWEIDIRFDAGALHAGDLAAAGERIAAVKTACGSAPLRVGLDAAELGSCAAVRRAASTALVCGADFVGTGGADTSATLPALALLLCEAVREHARRTGRMAGVVVERGADDAAAALGFLSIARETLGPSWPAPGRFRLTSPTPFAIAR